MASPAGGIVVVLSAKSGEQVYGTPTTPVNPNPNGGGGDTLPVTGFEVVLLVAAVVLALAVGWALNKMGGRK